MLKQGPIPPLSPVLLAGFLARPLPPAVLQPALDAAMKRINRRHPQLFERLEGWGAPVYVIDPTDLPLVFVLTADAQNPRVQARRSACDVAPAATIRGAAQALVELLEGRVDGDTLFFSRALEIDGDTEAVVALRNALDGAEIDLIDDFTSAFGLFERPLRHVVRLGQGVFRRFSADLADVHRALLAPTQNKIERQGEKLRTLEEKVKQLGAKARSRTHPSTGDA